MALETSVPEVVEPESVYYESDGRPPELSPEPFDKRPIIYGVIAALVITLIFVGIGVYLFLNPDVAAVVRDIFIIFLGLGTFVVILLLIALIVITVYLVLKINDLIHLLNRQVRPILTNVQQTVGNVRGTTSFLSDQAAKPVISAAATVAGVKAAIDALFRR